MNTILASATGMAGFADALETNLSSANLWNEITPLAGFLAAIALFSFGYYVFRKVGKGAAKGKFRL